MILVFIILGILIIALFSTFILINSTIKLELNKLHISNENKNLEINYELNLTIYAFNVLKIFKYTIDKEKVSKLKLKEKINIQMLKDNKEVNKEIIKSIKKTKYYIEYFNIEGYFATANPIISSNVYVILKSIPAIFIAPKLKGKYINEIELLNISKNIINVKANCIISEKIVNIINILHFIKKQGGINKNGKSSNRRSYAYSNE